MTSCCLLASMWMLCAHCTQHICDVNCLFLCLLTLLLTRLNSKNSKLHFIEISHISAIDRDQSDEDPKENAKDIGISNCPEYEAKIALSQNLRHFLVPQRKILVYRAINGHILPPSSCTSRRSPVAQSGANRPETDSRTGPSEKTRR